MRKDLNLDRLRQICNLYNRVNNYDFDKEKIEKLQKEDQYLEESQDKIEVSDKLQEPKKTSKHSDEKENEGKHGNNNSFKTIVIDI